MRPLTEPTLRALDDSPVAAWFLGPKAEQAEVWDELLSYIFADYIHWRRSYFPQDPTVISRDRRHSHEKWWDALRTVLDTALDGLKAHYPFHSPRYIAHMLSEQTLPSVLGYFAGLLYNPNNVTDEAAPVTVRLELEFGRMVAEMIGYNSRKSWVHLCSGGTVANLEALWVARNAQFTAFVLREHCLRYDVPFVVKNPNGAPALLTELDDSALLSLRPNESIFMTRKLAKFEVESLHKNDATVLSRLNASLADSQFNPRYRGYAAVAQRVGKRPVVFVSAAAHYCVKKAANVIGYGEDAVRLIPVTSKFRIDVDVLEHELNHIARDEYVAAVIGVVGSTEEGAVDPIHMIADLRDRQSVEKNRSFWFHIDAAWGGYLRSAFVGHATPAEPPQSLDDWYTFFRGAIAAQEKQPGIAGGKPARLSWDNPDVYKAYIAMPQADSVTIDPHKMGYVPYPAGVIAFKNGLVTELLTQRAQYISQAREGVSAIDEPPEITAVGPYVLEGSKPGFVALGCWLASKTIPLNVRGHGKLVKTTTLNAKKLHRYLSQHAKAFVQIERELGCAPTSGTYPHEKCPDPFTFVPLNDPDTNVVCFVALPMKWKGGRLDRVDCSLKRLNEINEAMHAQLDIPARDRGIASPHSKEYFVSKTSFLETQYSYHSIRELLLPLGIPEKDYRNEGLVVLRSTVMNPLYSIAIGEEIDFLWGYVRALHSCARMILGNAAPR